MIKYLFLEVKVYLINKHYSYGFMRIKLICC